MKVALFHTLNYLHGYIQKVCLLCILFAILIFHSCSKEPVDLIDDLHVPGVYDVSVKVDTLKRWFKVIIPSGYDHNQEQPLLLTYHGGNLSMGFMFNNRKDLIQRCDEENWILAFPNGANADGNKGAATWNAIHCCNPARKFQVDDLGFTEKIIDTLSAVLSINDKKVYAIGGSNGAMFIHKLAAELPHLFAAFAENQGTAGGFADSMSLMTVAEPQQVIPFLMIHGMSDQKVKFQGGWSGSLPRYDLSFAETVSLWAENNQCETNPDTSLVNGQNGDVWIIAYSSCFQNADIKAIAIENKGHGWPGLEESGFDGTNASIDFLKQYSK